MAVNWVGQQTSVFAAKSIVKVFCAPRWHCVWVEWLVFGIADPRGIEPHAD